jgi:hypothetical protein
MMSEISGEINPRQNKNQRSFSETLPSVIVEEGVSHESADRDVSIVGDDSLSQENEDSLLVMLEVVDDELKRAKTRLRSAQETALKYAGNNEILVKLNDESKFFQRQFDELVAKKDVILGKIKQLRNLSRAA